MSHRSYFVCQSVGQFPFYGSERVHVTIKLSVAGAGGRIVPSANDAFLSAQNEANVTPFLYVRQSESINEYVPVQYRSHKDQSHGGWRGFPPPNSDLPHHWAVPHR